MCRARGGTGKTKTVFVGRWPLHGAKPGKAPPGSGQTPRFSKLAIPPRRADPSLPDTAEEWLDEFSVFSIYQVLPEIISLWGLNVQTQSVSKKNDPQPSEG